MSSKSSKILNKMLKSTIKDNTDVFRVQINLLILALEFFLPYQKSTEL